MVMVLVLKSNSIFNTNDLAILLLALRHNLSGTSSKIGTMVARFYYY
jgi:hypothetical protein